MRSPVITNLNLYEKWLNLLARAGTRAGTYISIKNHRRNGVSTDILKKVYNESSIGLKKSSKALTLINL